VEVNNWLRPYFNNEDVFIITNEKLKDFGFGNTAKAMVFNRFEGSINTG
jgi:hypothetical protein